jgi:hypothetical protein
MRALSGTVHWVGNSVTRLFMLNKLKHTSPSSQSSFTFCSRVLSYKYVYPTHVAASSVTVVGLVHVTDDAPENTLQAVPVPFVSQTYCEATFLSLSTVAIVPLFICLKVVLHDGLPNPKTLQPGDATPTARVPFDWIRGDWPVPKREGEATAVLQLPRLIVSSLRRASTSLPVLVSRSECRL